jgi:rRNA maturation RNase YbeY
MPVTFHQQGADSSLLRGQKRKITSWILKITKSEHRILGDISIIYCSRSELLKMNKAYLGHNYHTDIITFDYNIENVVNGDLFIGIEQVLENAKTYNTKSVNELQRVIIHGVLHLLGYQDSTVDQKKTMRAKEDWAIEVFNTLK